MFERVTVGTLLQVEREIHRLVNPMKLIDFNDRRAADDPYMRQKLAQLHIECQAIRHGSLRRMTRRLRRLPRGPEGSTVRMWLSAPSCITRSLIAQ
ncbi:MAG: hypothetical protein WA005_10710 [Candidatus Binataceae bacterium]